LLDSKILSFGSFRESEDLSSIITDLEDLGFNDRTFSLPEIKEAWKKISWSYGVVEFSISSRKQQFEFENDGEEVSIYFRGEIEVEVDFEELEFRLEEELPQIPRIPSSGPRWSINQIASKLFDANLDKRIQDWVDGERKSNGPNWWIIIEFDSQPRIRQHELKATVDLDFRADLNEDTVELKAGMNSFFFTSWLEKVFEKK